MPQFVRKQYFWDFAPEIRHLPPGVQQRRIQEALRKGRTPKRVILHLLLLYAVIFFVLYPVFTNAPILGLCGGLEAAVFIAALSIWYQRRYVRKILRAEMLAEGIRPAVCFECRYYTEDFEGDECPNCGAALVAPKSGPPAEILSSAMPQFVRQRRSWDWDWTTPAAIRHFSCEARERLIAAAWKKLGKGPQAIPPFLFLVVAGPAMLFPALSLVRNPKTVNLAEIAIASCMVLAFLTLMGLNYWKWFCFLRALKEELLTEGVRPTVCFECRYYTEGFEGTECPNCGAALVAPKEKESGPRPSGSEETKTIP